MQEDLEVTGISRSGRVRKKSSKLMDFESPDDIDTKFKRQAPMTPKSFSAFKQDEVASYQEVTAQRSMDEGGTASGSESDYYDNNGDNPDSMESDSSASDEGSTRTPANSLYMMEKSNKKKLVVKDGRVVGRAKAQRKDKGKTRITAYMMWAKEARNELLRNHPEMDFSAISKRLGEMWANVNYNERYLWKRKAKRFAIQKEQTTQGTSKIIVSNPAPRTPGTVGRPPSNRTVTKQQQQQQISPVAHQANPTTPPSSSSSNTGVYRVSGCSAVDLAAHLKLLGESLAIIGERLREHEGQIAVSGSVSVLLDTLLCSLAPLVSITRAIPAIAPPAALLQDTLHNIAYIMPGV